MKVKYDLPCRQAIDTATGHVIGPLNGEQLIMECFRIWARISRKDGCEDEARAVHKLYEHMRDSFGAYDD